MTAKPARSSGGVLPDTMSAAQFARFRDLVEDRCGLHFDESRRTSLHASLGTRMQQLRLDHLDDYYRHLRAQPADEEFRKLINLATITETSFFRDHLQFRLLRRHILPTLLAERGGERKTLRIWSAGCSSGEEAYSIALTLWDMGLYRAQHDWTFEIVGTDVNTERLEAASRGVYAPRALRNVEGDRLQRHFRPAGRHFQLNDDVRRLVRFQYGNLTDEAAPPPSSERQDIILCKNVAIYFRPEVRRRLVRRLYEVLNDGGYLLLGHSESLWQMENGFALVEHDGAFCYRKMATPRPRAYAPGALTSDLRPRRTVVGPKRRGRSSPTSPTGPTGQPAGAAKIQAPPVVPREEAAGQYDRCLAMLQAGEWSQAEAAVDALIQSSPTFIPAYLLRGGLYVHRGRYAQAEEQAQCGLRLDDLDARAHLLLGMIAARDGRHDQAREALRRALYLDDSLALAYFWLGNLYRDRGDIERACREYEQMVRRHERRTLEFTQEFASDLTAEQLVDFCRRSVQRLRSSE
jgi:chemotaxis protein methyltransferase CheR